MGTLTIRNIDEGVKERLRVRAAMHGHSMEEEVRVILKRAVGGVDGAGLWALSRQLFDGDDGIAIALPPRAGDRSIPDFGESEDR